MGFTKESTADLVASLFFSLPFNGNMRTIFRGATTASGEIQGLVIFAAWAYEPMFAGEDALGRCATVRGSCATLCAVACVFIKSLRTAASWPSRMPSRRSSPCTGALSVSAVFKTQRPDSLLIFDSGRRQKVLSSPVAALALSRMRSSARMVGTCIAVYQYLPIPFLFSPCWHARRAYQNRAYLSGEFTLSARGVLISSGRGDGFLILFGDKFPPVSF